MNTRSIGWLEDVLVVVTVCVLAARLSLASLASAGSSYAQPLVLIALLLLPSLVPSRPNSAYAYCRRHSTPAASLLLSSCLLPCVFASQSLLSHHSNKDGGEAEHTHFAFYLASACSALAHFLLALSPDLRVVRRMPTFVLVAALSLLPLFATRLSFHPLQPLLTLITLVYMAVLLQALTSHLPNSFTLCELVVVSTLLSLLLGHITVALTLSLLKALGVVHSRDVLWTAELPSSQALLLTELFIAMAALLFLLPPRVICLAARPTATVTTAPRDSATPSAVSLNFRYIAITLPICAVVVHPLTWLLLHSEPISFLVDFLFTTKVSSRPLASSLPIPLVLAARPRLVLSVYWLFVLAVGLPLSPSIAGPTSSTPSVWSRVPPIVVRKWYHLLATLLFLPALLLDAEFTCVAAAVAFLLFLTVEYVRMHALQPLAAPITAFVSQYLDSRDEGPLILTHLYLLVGCVVTGGLHAMLPGAPHHAHLAGVYVLGVMDAMASVVGCSIGRHSWQALLSPGRAAAGGGGKTVEGTVGGVVSVVALHLGVLSVVGWGELSAWGFVRWCVATAAVGLMEAWTSQIDNLVLPLYYYVVWVTAVADAAPSLLT